MEVVAAEESDVASWMEVVREVEPLFGPMPDFAATLARAISRGAAFCVRSEDDGAVEGGVLLRMGEGSTPAECTINWLAVRSTARGSGVGAALMAHALALFPRPCRVSVVTFGEDNLLGHAARRLYQRFGFQVAEHQQPGPEGGTRQLFRLTLPDADDRPSPAADSGDPFDFDPVRRVALRGRVIAALEADPRVERVEPIGSLARGDADRYSDIDLLVRLRGCSDREFFFDLPAIMRTVGPTLVEGWGFVTLPHGYIGTFNFVGYPLFWQVDVGLRSAEHVDGSDLQRVSRWEQLFKMWVHAAKLVARADDYVEGLRTLIAKRVDTSLAADGTAAERLSAQLDLLADVGRGRGAPFEPFEAQCREVLRRVLEPPSASAGE